MPSLSTLSVATHTTPTFFVSYFQFLVNRRKRKQNGEAKAQLSYAEGYQIVRKFLQYASTHPLAELQRFTAHHVPVPRFVVRETVTISTGSITKAEHFLIKLLSEDPKTLELVGGTQWWKMRGRPLTAEWIEMKKDKIKRGDKSYERIIFYLHGGAHFFSSLETHRYQIQRHARKLNGVAFCPSYRLSPQYPFPCALLDALACYLELLDHPMIASSSQIVFSGDSSGGGLALSLLTLLRDLDLPLPAAGILISPWCDLSHSFPSINSVDSGDYIPSNGFHYRPGLAWPPIKTKDDLYVLEGETEPIVLDEQLQMYAPNKLLRHPLVSPVNHGSLGGLPPLYIAAGGAELLRDEIIYIAHKAANPSKYPPSQAVLESYPSHQRRLDANLRPTNVHLQVFDDCAHVTTTLSITEPAKYMYRGCANFGLWALAQAKAKSEADANSDHQHQQHHNSSSHSSLSSSTPHHDTEVDDLISLDSEAESSDSDPESERDESDLPSYVRVTGQAPRFHHHILRERVSIAGKIRPMELEEELEALQMSPSAVGAFHPEPVNKWLNARAKYDKKYSSDLAKYRKIRTEDRIEAEKTGFLLGQFAGENPPLCSLAGFHDPKLAHEAGQSVDETGKDVNLALAAWASISVQPDEQASTISAEVKEQKEKASELRDDRSS